MRRFYGRDVQGLELLSDLDLSGDAVRDISFREITCGANGACVSSFYVLASSGDGYRVITGADAS